MERGTAAGGAAAAGGRAAAGGGEGGIVVALAVAEGVAAALNGIGVGATEVPVVDPHAANNVITDSVIKSRRTQIATGWRYAEMECPEVFGDCSQRAQIGNARLTLKGGSSRWQRLLKTG
jgi:hypothetical protein